MDGHLTGVQRYTLELLTRFGDSVSVIKPDRPLHGFQGHLWEQFVLPNKGAINLLWSPSNTGPLTVENQVVTIHDLSPMDHPEWMNFRFAAWYRYLTPRLTRRVRGVLAVSNFTKQRLVEYFPDIETKVQVVYEGVDPRFLPSDSDSIRCMREILGIPSPYYLLGLGSLEPRKNLQRLLRAWTQVQVDLPGDLWLVLAGAKGKSTVFGDVSFQNLPPRVLLTGHVPDNILPALYSGAVASVYLSLYEGFGLPPLEAMACGTPTITSNVASLPEVVGDAGMTVDPYDVEQIADGLRRIVDDAALRDDLRQKGLERVKLFSWDRAAALTWKVLRQAAD